MQKKTILYRFLLCVLLLSMPFITFGQERITITTYYPSPHGVYRNLRLYPSINPPNCDANYAGTVYYDRTDNDIMLCNRPDPAVNSYEWMPLRVKRKGDTYVNEGLSCLPGDTAVAYRTVRECCDGRGPSYCAGGTRCCTRSHEWSDTDSSVETCRYSMADGSSTQSTTRNYNDTAIPGGGYIEVFWSENRCVAPTRETCRAQAYVLCESTPY